VQHHSMPNSRWPSGLLAFVIAKHASLKDFKVVLWRQEPDADGCNWNARIECVRGRRLNDCSWWDVVPQMRERFKLM
jgi:hypothetical protein